MENTSKKQYEIEFILRNTIPFLEKEANLKKIVESLPIGMSIHDQHSKVLMHNAIALQLLDLTDDQFLGKTSYDKNWQAIHPNGTEFNGSTHPVVICSNTKKPVLNVVMGVHQPNNNAYVWLNIDAVPILNELDKIDYVLCTFKDITDSIEFQKRHEQLEDNMNQIFYHYPIPMIMVDDTTSKIYRVNSKMSELMGYATDEMIGQETAQYFAVHTQMNEAFNHFEKNKSIQNYAIDFLTKKGDRLSVLLSTETIVINGKKLRLSGFIDVTERNKTEALLERSQNNLITIFENTELGYALVDKDLTIVSFNDKMQKYVQTDLHVSLQIGVYILDIYSEERRPFLSTVYQKALAGENTHYEISYQHPNQTATWYNIQFNPVKASENNVLGIVISAENITARKNAETELNRSYELATDQNKRLLNFSYIVSHNIKSHTNKIKTFLRLIEMSKTLEEKNMLLLELNKVSDSLDETMVHLSEIVQINTCFQSIIKPLHLNSFIGKVLNMLKDIISTKNAIIKNNISNEQMIAYNPAYLESILYNFLSNALKYSHPLRSPIIEINTYNEHDKVILTIADNGLGIDLEKHGAKLFGMYKTFHGNPDAKGLGLFMTKNQVEAMNGKIEVASALDKGTTFNIWLN